MAFIGNTPSNQGFAPAVDYFNGDGTTVTFTLSRPVASVAQLTAVIDNVIQNPSSAFTVTGNAITFTSAPLAGTNNIWVEYTSLVTTYAAISQDPSVIGDITATGGFLATGDFGNTFTDGTIVDYVTGNARITTGPVDGLTIYNGGPSARNALMTLSAAGNAGIGNTNPTAKLEISTTGFSGHLRLSGSTQNGMWFSKTDGTSGFAVGRSVGADNGQNYFIYDADAAATRFLINSSGYITTPAQPAFRAYTTNGTFPTTGGNTINFNNIQTNVSGSFASTGGNAFKRFTAPVAGQYLFTASLMGNSGTGRYYFGIFKNGGNVAQSGGSANDYGNFCASIVLEMAVNDYVEVFLQSGTLYPGSTVENYFSGTLLG